MEREFQSEERDVAVTIPLDHAALHGNLNMPVGARGLVLFAHGSGSGRHSPRNRYVASMLREGALATLLMDFLTTDEEEIDLRTREFRFDIDLLARRLVGVCDWARTKRDVAKLDIGLFGASTGAAAALITAVERPDVVRAVVSRGGRPDLALAHLSRVLAPTLLIVGGEDMVVIGMNREAFAELRAEKKLEIVPGATHRFEEPGTLEEVARSARRWFVRHLRQRDAERSGIVRDPPGRSFCDGDARSLDSTARSPPAPYGGDLLALKHDGSREDPP